MTFELFAGFMVGLVVGGTLGILLMAVMVVGARADEEIEDGQAEK